MSSRNLGMIQGFIFGFCGMLLLALAGWGVAVCLASDSLLGPMLGILIVAVIAGIACAMIGDAR